MNIDEKWRNFESLCFQYQEHEDEFIKTLNEINIQWVNNIFTYKTSLTLKKREHFGIFMDILKNISLQELTESAKENFKRYKRRRYLKKGKK